MEERAEGIILRTRPLTDTSLVVMWLTPEFGRVSTVAKGARRPKSPFAGKLDLFFEAQFSFVRSRRSELHTLREVLVSETHAALRMDFALLHQASYFTVLIEQGTERETPLPELHGLFSDYLRHLPGPDRVPEALLAFESQFLAIMGFEPSISAPPHATEMMSRRFVDLAPLSRQERNDLNRQLRAAIGSMLDRVPPQRARAIEAMRSSPLPA